MMLFSLSFFKFLAKCLLLLLSVLMTTARGECDYVLGTSDASSSSSSSLFWVPHHHHHHHRLISPSEMMVRGGGGGAAGVLAFLK